MGFQGQLSSVNLTDIFQTLHMNRQTGTLSVTGSAGILHLYFDNGQIVACTVPMMPDQAFLLNAMVRKSLLSEEQAARVFKHMQDSRQPLRQLLLASNFVSETEVDDLSAWCIEELSCPIFEWQEGDFTFLDGPPIDALLPPDVIRMGKVGLSTTQLVLEATRRKDEWKRIREVITNNNALFVVDSEGRNLLRTVQTDAEMLKVLRYLDGRRTLDQIATEVGVPRFDTYAIASQLVLAGVVRPRTPEEVIADTVVLRNENQLELAKSLLENTIIVANVPEVVRPLAEVCALLKQAPRAVELYLELIQTAQDQGDLAQARADLDTVLELSPDDPDLQFDRANVLSELGAVDEAANAYVTAAQAYLTTRDTNRAIDACHRAKNLVPRAPDPHRYLAKAYLMDGQSENAVVEYKSLWHALLTGNRPRRALDILSNTLETDCRFNNIKDQVLSHAQNSEAIKTSKAMRILAYMVIALLVCGSLFFGAVYYQKAHQAALFRDDISALRELVKSEEPKGHFDQLFARLEVLHANYDNMGLGKEISALNDVHKAVRADFESFADQEVEGDMQLMQSQHDLGRQRLQEAMTHFPGTPAEDKAFKALTADTEARAQHHGHAALEAAQRKWEALDWDGALGDLKALLQDHALPESMLSDANSLAATWETRLQSAKDLFERAERLDDAGKTKEAMIAFGQAARGKGEQYAAQALIRQGVLEKRVVDNACTEIDQALDAGDDKHGFEKLDQLRLQLQNASSKETAQRISAMELPFQITLSSPRTVLVVHRSGANDAELHAPASATGSWSQRITYQIAETVTVEARRPGFAAQSLSISIQGRQSHAEITLVRGALWQTSLGAAPSCVPVSNGKYILVATNRGTLAIVDTQHGLSVPVDFPATVDEFKFPPFIFQNLAYVVLENRLHVIDIATHAEVWHYPGDE